MGNNKDLRIGALQEKRSYSLIVNKYNDTIELPLDDANFVGRFSCLLKWLNDYEQEAVQKEKELHEKFSGHELMTEDENGDVDFDFEYLEAVVNLNNEIYTAMFNKIEEVFGKDSLKKYFRASYESSPDFIPDEDALADFLEEIAPVINILFDTKLEYKRKRQEKFGKYKKVSHK